MSNYQMLTMRSYSLLLCAVLSLLQSFSVPAQIIGLTGGPHVALSSNIQQPAGSWIVGVYYHQHLTDKLSFQTGIDLTQYDQQMVFLPIHQPVYHNLIEIPISISYDLLNALDRTRNLNISTGCSFGKITNVNARGLVNGDDTGPYISFAFGPALEYQFPAGRVNAGALGLRTRYMANLFHSHDFLDVGIFARFGFNLKPVKDDEEEWSEM